ncbi:MAG: hypothetical protein ACRDLN_01410 [Solirubrobacteraceae bacterium]
MGSKRTDSPVERVRYGTYRLRHAWLASLPTCEGALGLDAERRVTIDSMAPRSKAVLAREHLDRALPAVAAEDHAEAVAWLFVSLEAAIVAVADAQGLDTRQAHWRKAEVAAELHAAGVLPTDYADTLQLLNEARKAVFYEGEDPDLGEQSLEDIASIVESAVEQAEQVAAR